MTKAKKCSVPECGNRHKAKGFCNKHYSRLLIHGDPLFSKGTERGEVQEFFKTVVLPYEGPDCLIWPYSVDSNGYGAIGMDGKTYIVSRLACEEQNGPPPTPDHEAAHSCGKGHLGCVTKGHLSWKTRSGNMADRLTHGTHARGERSVRSKLKEEQVRAILDLRGIESQSAIAKKFCIDPSTVSQIQSGKRWSWLETTP